MQEAQAAGPDLSIAVALVGLAGVILGLLISEFFRRRNRVEFYSQQLFIRRLEAHEGLLALVNAGSSVAGHVLGDPKMPKATREGLISSAIHDIAIYVDNAPMLIDPLVGAHCTAFLMGAEDIGDINDPTEREAAASAVWQGIRETKAMIRREAGADEIDKHFRSVARSRPSSPIIERIKELQKAHGKTDS